MHKLFRRLSRSISSRPPEEEYEYREKDSRPQSPLGNWRPHSRVRHPQNPYTPNYGSWCPPPGAPPPPGASFPGYVPPQAPFHGWGTGPIPTSTHHDHSNHTSSAHYAECAEIWDRFNNKWVICDPNDLPVFDKQRERKDEWNYFCVTKRFSDRLSEPRPVLTHFAEPLQRFVINTCSSFGIWGTANVSVDGTQGHEVEMGQAFRALKKMKERLEEVQRALSPGGTLEMSELVSLARSLGHMQVDKKTPRNEIDQFLKDLEKQLSVLVGYLDEKFKPTAERLASAIKYGYMEFDLLPYYFEPGQEVSIKRPDGDLAMKVTQVNVNENLLGPADYGEGPYTVTVEGYGYTWEGNCWLTAKLRETCYHFVGTKELSELYVKLLTDEKRKELAARGMLYKNLAGIHYRTCDGDRIVVDRSGYLANQSRSVPKRDKRDKRMNRQRSYDSGEWPDDPYPQPYPAAPAVPLPPASPVPMPMASWDDLSAAVDPTPFDPTFLADDLLCFLPTEVYGYNLAQKRWTHFLLESVRPVEYDRRAWDHLVLDTEVKTLIKGLVEVTTKSVAESGALVNDVIARKGGGLTSVLYGPPGTGKTLTAEAVAELLQRPLLAVGSSDLPREPSEMESKLKHVLGLATSWDAVLLIDEADVFLEQRSLHEIERNALVSAALRVLEYHRGVVFLTTNRIKVFDEAFLSRFSIAVKYPELNKAGRYLIWSRFLALAGYKIVSSPFVTNDDLNEKIIPRKSIEDLAEKNFNGRTIKNLVRTAQALALSSNSPLRMEHIHIVVSAQERFLEDFAAERSKD
ncbi:aaa family atpase [Moniliophthora roreri MCA 2997]|uniref:Aaa family atpase n=1 Tax=Moniliophthora roreri (strain MCA 2997) TaxID=1381753 RepID=V2XDP4_MONRO|nr:aaa family atpase [Moniliophthora roreri MCA 2997]